MHLEYVLATDALAAAWKVLMVGAGQAAPQELNEDPRNPAIHAAVDKAVSSHLEPLLREAILSNRAVIPGLDLATALGIAQ